MSEGRLSKAAGDVAWLGEVTRAPEKVPRDKLRRLADVLLGPGAVVVKTRREWTRHRQSLRAAWMKFLGPMPLRPISAGFEVLREDKLKRVRRQLIRYEAEAGQEVEAYLLFPVTPTDDRGPRPAIVALHQTTRDTIEQIAGVKGPPVQQLGLQLAQRGFVVICPRNYLWQNVARYTEAVERFKGRHPGTLGMHKMLYDSQRAVDILAGLPEVDAGRIGATGHSLGGKETLYLAAFDERIAASVASEGGVGFGFTNWNAPWYLGKGIDDETFPLNHHQLLALAAPRPFLVLAGENTTPQASDGDRTWPLLEAALPAWRLYGDRPRLGMYNHRQGHSIPPRAFARLHEWLATYLRKRGTG